MAAAGHHMRVRLMKKRSAGNQRDGHFHGVELIEIFFTWFCTGAHSQNSIFAVEMNGDSFGQMAGYEIGNLLSEAHIGVMGQFERGTLLDLFARQSRLS